MFVGITATTAERSTPRPGDDLVAPADVIMNRAATLDADPATVWPWLVQLGKRRAGWYLPRGVERFMPTRRRAARRIEPQWQHLQAGDVIPDYGGKHEIFQVDRIQAPTSIVYSSQRGKTSVTWSINLQPDEATGHTRVSFRLRMAPVRHKWLAETVGDFIDALTIAGMVAGLRERLAEQPT